MEDGVQRGIAIIGAPVCDEVEALMKECYIQVDFPDTKSRERYLNEAAKTARAC